MLQTHFKLAGPKKKNSKKNSKKKTCRTDPIEARDFIWLSGEGGDEGDLKTRAVLALTAVTAVAECQCTCATQYFRSPFDAPLPRVQNPM